MSRFVITALVACGFAAAIFALRPTATNQLERQALYICRETGELFLGPGGSAPRIHPDTGRATLWPAVFCPQCETWSAAPVLERLYGHAELLDCPSCGTRRYFDGPPPEEATEL